MPQSRQLAAIMFTDMVGYTALMQQSEQLAIQKRERHKKIFEEALARHDGKLLQYYGDGTMSIFSSAVNAVHGAIEMQTLFLTEPKVDVRVGIHIGDVMFDDNGIYGDSVNVASRIESLSTPGGIFISEKLFDEVKNNDSISAKSLGYFELKNVKQPMQVYAIANPGIVMPSREDLRGKTKTALNGIAVLPFASLSSDPENEFFCDGMTEELINVLAKVDGLQVTSRTSAFAFKGRNEDVREIAAKLNVNKLIEGSVRKAGNKVRITVQLINAADGYHFWSETFDRNLEDIFAVQDDISRAIANKLRENLSTEQHQSQLVKAPTENIEAYKKYLEALHLYDHVSPEKRKRGLELFIEAGELEPNLVNAHAYVAIGYAFLGQTGQIDTHYAFEMASKYSAKAMEIDPENSMSLVTISLLKLYVWEWDNGFQLLQRALQINPSNSMAHLLAAEYYQLFLNREKELEHAKLVYQLDPLSAAMIGEAAWHHAFAAKYREALDLANKALALDPQNRVSRNIRALATGLIGDWNEALNQMRETQKLGGDFTVALLSMGIAYANLGQMENVREVFSKVKSIQEQNPNANLDFLIAFLHGLLGEMDKFYEYYDRGIEKKELWLLEFYGTEMMKPVWFDERIVASRKKLGLPVFEKPENH